MAIDEIKAKTAMILRSAGVRRAAVFGSFARGDAINKSDLDLLIEFPKGKGLFDFVALKHRLEEVLGRKVDLVTYRSLSPYLRDQVLREQVSLL